MTEDQTKQTDETVAEAADEKTPLEEKQTPGEEEQTPGEEEQTPGEEGEVEQTPEDPEETPEAVGSISGPVSAVVKAFDGRELATVSLATQTEWSWMEDLRLRQERGLSAGEAAAAPAGRSEGESDGEAATAKDSEFRSGRSSRRRAGGSVRSGRSSGVSSVRASRAKSSGIPAYPEPRIDDEFGILLVDDEDSDLSDTNVHDDFVKGDAASAAASAAGQKASSNFMDEAEAAAADGVLPSVGPPQILKYLRESEIPMEDAFPNRSVDDLQQVNMQEGETCDFCGRQILSLPSADDQVSQNPERLYCCAEFRKLLEFALQYQSKLLREKEQEAGKLIDVAPHSRADSRGKKSAQERELLREQAEKRRRQQQLERQRRAAEAQATAQAKKREQVAREVDTDLLEFDSENAVGRQMRTINYSLASKRCLDEGWTLPRPPSPLAEAAGDWQAFEFDLDEVTDMAAGLGITPRGEATPFLEKFYPNGQKFLTIFSDRTGNVFYPSGNLALLIGRLSEKPCHLVYVVHEDLPTSRTRVLGVFDTVGRGTCYAKDGRIKVNYDGSSGIDLDSRGGRRRHWHWHGGGAHVHAPPFQPIAMAVNRVFGLRLVARDNISLSFVTASRSCKINVGARFKMPPLDSQSQPANQLTPIDLVLAEASTKIAGILEKITFLSSHPNYPRPDRLPTSVHLEARRQRNLANRAKLGIGRAS